MPTPGHNTADRAAESGSADDVFSTFYRANYQRALHLVRCRTSGCDCEGLLAECFVVAWQHFQAKSELSQGWFYGVVRNKIGDFYRSGRRREMPTSDIEIQQEANDPSPGYDVKVDVRRALRALPALHSEVLLLVYWCDLSGVDAARALGVREGALRVRLHRAKRAFLKEYGPRDPVGGSETLEEVRTWIA